MNVNGNVRATAIGVVMPGTAPTKVPIKTPKPKRRTFCQVAKIKNAWCNTSNIVQRPWNRKAVIPKGMGMPAIL